MHRRLGVIRLLINKTSSLSIFSPCVWQHEATRGGRVCRLRVHHGRAARDAHCSSFRDSARGPGPANRSPAKLDFPTNERRSFSSVKAPPTSLCAFTLLHALPFPFRRALLASPLLRERNLCTLLSSALCLSQLPSLLQLYLFIPFSLSPSRALDRGRFSSRESRPLRS